MPEQLNPKLRDEQSKMSWDESYLLDTSPMLWSEAPVPYAYEAARFARSHRARLALDLPCGDGRNLWPIAREVHSVVGADSSPNAVALASRIGKTQNISNCYLQQADIFATPFIPNQFDLVFCWDLLGHLVKVEDAIRELLRVTRVGGHVIGSIFAKGDSTRGIEMTRLSIDEYLYRDRFYYRFYDRHTMELMISTFDVKVESIELATWNEPPHEGFREYEHQHQSWAFTLRKTE